jgi:hypothetical protein
VIGLQRIPGYKYSVGIAYIAMPSDLERETYIRDCYKNCFVSIKTEDGGFLNRIAINPETMNFIDFPTEAGKLGSAVVYVVDDLYQQPHIIGRIQSPDELGDGREHGFKFRRALDGGFVEVSGSGKDRSINLLVDGEEQKGSVNIHIFNKNQDCELKVDVTGDVNVVASGVVTATSHKGVIIQTLGEGDSTRFEQTDTEHKFTSQKVIVNDGEDPMVLGNELKTFLENLIDEIGAITTVTALGLQPIVNKVKVTALKDKLNTILSKEGFLNK